MGQKKRQDEYQRELEEEHELKPKLRKEMKKKRQTVHQFEARLALGEVEMKYGNPASGRTPTL